MKTYFAIPERETRFTIEDQIKQTAEHELIQSLMKVAQGLFVVLNDKRQIIALNESFLETLGVEEGEDIFGLRLGETVKCIYSDLMAGGCGTSEFCSTCGAAISMVTALEKGQTVEKICTIRTRPDGEIENLYFKVKSTPILISNKNFILIFLEDITYQHKMAELERIFFHDIYNKVSGIVNGCEILKYQNSENLDIVQIIYDLTYQMVREIEFQKRLLNTDNYNLAVENEYIKLNTIYQELDRVFSNHSVIKNKTLEFPNEIPYLKFQSDISIIIRVLTNMIKNALEASKDGDKVKVYHLINDDNITFEVWNHGFIEDSTAFQIFNRNFSTKKGLGHGFGTFSMKLLGEEFLGGRISFTTDKKTGTTFIFSVPLYKVE